VSLTDRLDRLRQLREALHLPTGQQSFTSGLTDEDLRRLSDDLDRIKRGTK